MATPTQKSLFIIFTLLYGTTAIAIGVNYGTVASHLPQASQVAAFIKSQTFIDAIKLFDADPQIIRAFAETNISLTISTLNSDILALANPAVAQIWVRNNILPFYNKTLICRVVVGNEVLATNNKNLIASLLRAMRSLHGALNGLGIKDIEVTTPHSLGILSISEPPSAGRFRRGYETKIFAPMLEFHRETNSSFLVNPYPYFGFTERTLDYALFKTNPGILDHVTRIRYMNMFDAQMDAVYSAMKRLGYEDVRLVVAETGWPSVGDLGQVGVNIDAATSYNANLVKHVSSGIGTPLMANRTFETYIFSLFNENLKPTIQEQNFGLFRPDFSPVYDVGVLRNPKVASPTASSSKKRWCMPKSEAGDGMLLNNLNFACTYANCTAINEGGECYEPATLRNHASFAMNTYYQSQQKQDSACDFDGTGAVTFNDPSYGSCVFVA